jgi:hypothetical protein
VGLAISYLLGSEESTDGQGGWYAISRSRLVDGILHE